MAEKLFEDVEEPGRSEEDHLLQSGNVGEPQHLKVEQKQTPEINYDVDS